MGSFKTKRVTLSFDNGPVSGVTERVLDVLDQHGVKASFFAIGNLLDAPGIPALLDDIQARGHWLGNHSENHAVAFGDCTDEAFAQQEIELAQQRLADWSRPEKLFRPFGNYGLLGTHIYSTAALEYLRSEHYTSVLWNYVPGDWKDPQGWDASCMPEIGKLEWAVPVLHDIPDASLNRLSVFIRRLKDQGVEFVQHFPDELITTRDGEYITVPEDFISDLPPPAQRPWLNH